LRKGRAGHRGLAEDCAELHRQEPDVRHRELTDRIFSEGLKGDLEAGGRKYGLVLDFGGYHKNVFTLSPAFTITRKEMDLALELLDQLFRRCRAQ